MKLGLIDAIWWESQLDWTGIYRTTRGIGFDFIDLIVDPDALTPDERRAIRDAAAAVELPVVSVPCVAFGLTDPFQSVRQFHIERAIRHVEFAAELGADLLLAVGEYVWNNEVIPPATVWEQAVENTRVIARRAADLGIDVVVENEPFELSIVNTVERMAAFATDVGLPNVKLCVDLSHLWLLKTEPGELGVLRDLIGHVHLSDCHGTVHEDLPPGHGTAPLVEYLNEIRQLGYDGTVAIELQRLADPTPEATLDWVREAFRGGRQTLAALPHQP